MRRQEYQRLVRRREPPRPVLGNALRAFLIGGIICAVGQGVLDFFLSRGMSPQQAAAPLSIVMVFLGSLFTALGLYDRLGKVGGMGAGLPITGFANTIAAAGMEYRREGLVLGVGAKLFTVAGPVIVFGLVTAFAVGLVHWLLRIVS